jgi:hypothetical protein
VIPVKVVDFESTFFRLIYIYIDGMGHYGVDMARFGCLYCANNGSEA